MKERMARGASVSYRLPLFFAGGLPSSIQIDVRDDRFETVTVWRYRCPPSIRGVRVFGETVLGEAADALHPACHGVVGLGGTVVAGHGRSSIHEGMGQLILPKSIWAGVPRWPFCVLQSVSGGSSNVCFVLVLCVRGAG